MDSTTKTVLTILKASLFGGELSLPEHVDWIEVYKELKVHAISCIPGSILSDFSGMDEKMLAGWTAEVIRNMRRHYHMLSCQDELLGLLKAAGVDAVVLKGAAAAKYYPQPDCRSMGDIDLLVQRGEAERAMELMLANGYQLSHAVDHNTRHYCLHKDGVEFEIHRAFSESDNPVRAEILDNMLFDGIEQAERCEMQCFDFPVLPEMQNGLVLLEHIRQHLNEGIGLRQILDWMLYAASSLDDDCWKSTFQPAARACELERLALVMTRMGQLYLGLPEENHAWCMDEDEETCKALMMLVLGFGDFGVKQGKKRDVSKTMTSYRSIPALLRDLQKHGCYNYRHLIKKYPFVRPFAWLLRIFRLIALGLKQKTSLLELKESYQASRERIELFEKLGITYQINSGD